MSDEELTVEQEEGVESPEIEQDEELSEEEQLKAKLKEAITVESEEIGALRQKLTITVPREMLDERMSDQFAELKRDAVVPGFRKGHAPLRLVEKRFASDVSQQLSSELISGAFMAAVEKEDLKPLGDPLFCIKLEEKRVGEDRREEVVEVEKLLSFDKAIDHLELPKEGELTFVCEVELKPDFELPEMEKIPLERPAISIDDDDVDTQLNRLCASRGRYVPVEDGTVEIDDLLYADVKLSVGADVLEDEQNVELPARDSRLSGIPLVGLGEALAGKKSGEQATIEATVPDDHENIDIRGKTAVFEITIREMKRFEMPPLDAEFITTLGYDSEDELRKTVRSDMESRLDSELRQGMHGQIGKYLVDNTTLEIPEGLSQRQMDRSISRRRLAMMQAGIPEAEIDKSTDEMRAKAHDQAVRDLKLFFIMEKIAEDRDITVPEEQLNSAIAALAQRANKRFDRMRDELSKGEGLITLYVQLRDEQILDDLLADAQITETKSPKKKTAKKKGPKAKAVKKAAVKKTT